jgi:hypothetical protein
MPITGHVPTSVLAASQVTQKVEPFEPLRTKDSTEVPILQSMEVCTSTECSFSGSYGLTAKSPDLHY